MAVVELGLAADALAQCAQDTADRTTVDADDGAHDVVAGGERGDRYGADDHAALLRWTRGVDRGGDQPRHGTAQSAVVWRGGDLESHGDRVGRRRRAVGFEVRDSGLVAAEHQLRREPTFTG